MAKMRNLYAAVVISRCCWLDRDGTVKGIYVLAELRARFTNIWMGGSNSLTDPQNSIYLGYMDLMSVVNLPFSNPEQAIERLEKFAGLAI